jgi:hypothetical protein
VAAEAKTSWQLLTHRAESTRPNFLKRKVK